MHGPRVSALHDPRREGQVWPEPATWPGIPYVQGMSGEQERQANPKTDWRYMLGGPLIGAVVITGLILYFSRDKK